MSEIKVSQVTEIENSELREIAMRVVNTMQLAAEKATAHQAEPATYPISSDPNSFEQLFQSRFQQLRPEQQQAAISKVMTAINAPEAERVRVYGDLAKVDLRSETAVEKQTENLSLPDSLKFLQSETNSLLESPSQVLSRTAAGLTNLLELRIHRVKCFDDTSEWGKDEISLGGSTIDESGNTEKISAFEVGNFKRGTEVNYSPPRIFTTFDLLKSPGVQYPRSYFATFVLAEIDWGGFSDFLNKLLDKIKEEVIKALTPLATALGTTIGAMIGSSIPILGTAIGAAIGAIVGWAVGKIFELFKSWWGDEIFAPITLQANIPSLDARSPQGGEVSFPGYGGEYRLYYDWRIEVPPTPHPVAQGDDMQPGEVLNPGQSISSTNGQYTFVYQGDGNLVLYRNRDGKPLWGSTNTWGKTDGVCVMQGDGNLVIYDSNSNPIWASETWQHPGSRLVVQSDGNVVMYSPNGTSVWATNTWQPPTPAWAVMGDETILSVGVSSWNSEVIDLFVRGTDNQLYYKWYNSNNGGWMQGYEHLGQGEISFSPVAVSGGGSDLIDVFARGIGANDGVYHKVWQGNVWSGWQRLGSTDILSGPGLSWEPGRLLGVFVRGGDNALYLHQYTPNDGWVGPWPLDGQISSSPAAIALVDGPGHVFARGMDNALWHRWYDNGWQNWESLGGPIGGQISSDPESGPSVSSWGPRRLDVFVRGTDDAVWHRWSEDGGVSWSNWESLGGIVTSSPASISRAPNQIEVFVRGTDSKLYHIWWDGTAWRP